jgi:MFS transporter, SP family, inositol transporter
VQPSQTAAGDRGRWRRTLLAAMANYIDAGSIVAGAVALPIWAAHFGFGDSFVSFLGAFSSNAIAAGLGALVGGRICDLLGRKRIYQWDLLLYAFGTLWIVFAVEPWMLLIGFFTVGVTVGADVPASWTLITETAPNERRGRFAGLAQLLWYVGAIAPLLLGLALLDLEMLATRIIFAHLLVVALITWALRQRMTESVLWEDARRQEEPNTASSTRNLLNRRFAGALAFLIVMYGVWNLVAGTYGLFFPYILDAVGSTTDRANLVLQAIWFVSTALAVACVYMPLIDRVGRRSLLVWSSLLQLAAFVPFMFFDVTFFTALINVVLFGAGAGIGQQSLFQLWSGELFPTLLRSTAQGFMFGVVRIALGGWILLLPVIQDAGFQTLAAILFGMLAVSGLVGVVFAPETTGRDLDETASMQSQADIGRFLRDRPARERARAG